MSKYSHYDYPFFEYSTERPYVTKRQMAIIHNVLNIKDVEKRCAQFVARGFNVKKCYMPTYNRICGMTYMPRLNEIRIIIGRPKCHEPRQVYAIVISPRNKE